MPLLDGGRKQSATTRDPQCKFVATNVFGQIAVAVVIIITQLIKPQYTHKTGVYLFLAGFSHPLNLDVLLVVRLTAV